MVVYKFVYSYWDVYLKWPHFIVYEDYFNKTDLTFYFLKECLHQVGEWVSEALHPQGILFQIIAIWGGGESSGSES